MARKNQRRGPKFDPLAADEFTVRDLAARITALGRWIRSPGFHGGQARAQALDELAFLRENVWWRQYKRWRKTLDTAAWNAALEWVKLDREETEQELLETLARSIRRIAVTDKKGHAVRMETDEEYLDRLRRIRSSFRAGPVV